MSFGSRTLAAALGSLLVAGCSPHGGPPPALRPPESDGDDLLASEEGAEEEPAVEPELVLDPGSRPDWLGLATGIGQYRGLAAIIAIGSAKAEGEMSMAHLVARRRARDSLHRMGGRVGRYLATRVRLGPDATLLLETQLAGILDILLPDQRRFVPVWEDRANRKVYAAILIPLERFLSSIRDHSDVPDKVRAHVSKSYDQVWRDMLGGKALR